MGQVVSRPRHGSSAEARRSGRSTPGAWGLRVANRCRRAVLSPLRLDPLETSSVRRGFPTTARSASLERIGLVFSLGYNAALDAGRATTALLERLAEPPPHERGWAHEGAGMALALLDRLVPWKRDRWAGLHDAEGERFGYLIHVGAGWALARLRRPIEGPPAGTDPVLGWLVVDGYGFHEGYFHEQASLERGEVPVHVTPRARPVFDQGLGRSLVFVSGADPARIGERIRGLARGRRADLWTGVGLGAAYAGVFDREGLETLRSSAADHAPSVALGAAFAAKARQRGENLATATDEACRVLCGTSAERAALETDASLKGLSLREESTYRNWQARLREHFARAQGVPA